MPYACYACLLARAVHSLTHARTHTCTHARTYARVGMHVRMRACTNVCRTARMHRYMGSGPGAAAVARHNRPSTSRRHSTTPPIVCMCAVVCTHAHKCAGGNQTLAICSTGGGMPVRHSTQSSVQPPSAPATPGAIHVGPCVRASMHMRMYLNLLVLTQSRACGAELETLHTAAPSSHTYTHVYMHGTHTRTYVYLSNHKPRTHH